MEVDEKTEYLDFVGHCAICLSLLDPLQSEQSEQLKCFADLWQYVCSSVNEDGDSESSPVPQFNYIFFKGLGERGTLQFSQKPPTCNDCQNKLETLERLHEQLTDIKKQLEEEGKQLKAIMISCGENGVNSLRKTRFERILLEEDVEPHIFDSTCKFNRIFRTGDSYHKIEPLENTDSPASPLPTALSPSFEAEIGTEELDSPFTPDPIRSADSLRNSFLTDSSNVSGSEQEDSDTIPHKRRKMSQRRRVLSIETKVPSRRGVIIKTEASNLSSGEIENSDSDCSSTNKKRLNQICPLCPRKTRISVSKMELHLTKKHAASKVLKCPHCPLMYPSRDLYVDHLADHISSAGETLKATTTAVIAVHCDLCGPIGQGFTSAENLRLHNSIMHGNIDNREFPCDFCPKIFPSVDVLNTHVRVRHMLLNKSYCQMCPECSEKVPVSEIKAHLETHKPELILECPHCPFVYSSREEYIDHLDKHLQRVTAKSEKDRIAVKVARAHCDICGKKGPEFNRGDKLRHHYFNKHGVGQKFICEICSNQFISIASLRSHLFKFHGKKLSKYVPKKKVTGASTSRVLPGPSTRVFKTDMEPGSDNVNRTSIQSSGSPVNDGLGNNSINSNDIVEALESSSETKVKNVSSRRSGLLKTKVPLPSKRKTTRAPPSSSGDSDSSDSSDSSNTNNRNQKRRNEIKAKFIEPYSQRCDVCEEQIPLAKIITHLKTHVGDYVYPCLNPSCRHAFISPYRMESHHLFRNIAKCRIGAGIPPKMKHLEYIKKNKTRACTSCRFTCNQMGTLTKHLSQHETAVQPFSCPIESCAKKFTLKQSVEVHLLTHVGVTREYQWCPMCPEKTRISVTKIKSHLTETHGASEVIECPHCPFMFHSNEPCLEHLIHHMNSAGKRGDINPVDTVHCDICPSKPEFKNPGKFRLHYFNEHGIGHDKVFHCDFCPKKFSTAGILNSHTQWRHSSTARRTKPTDTSMQECGICLKNVALSETKAHLESHKPQLIVECPHCPFVFPSREDYIDHLVNHFKAARTNHVAIDVIHCDICGVTGPGFNRSDKLRHHYYNEHGVGQLLICEVCSKEFVSVASLYGHKRTFHSEKPAASKKSGAKTFQCDQCPKLFGNNHALETHQIRHHGAEPFKCSVCPETFFHRGHLVKHENIHKGISYKESAAHICPECGKSYPYGYLLKEHRMARHENVMPHQCDLCEKGFTSGSTLKKHKRGVHEGVRYPCEVCKMQFNHKDNLKRHMLIHTRERPYECDICGQTFRQVGVFKTHKKSHEELGDKFRPTGPKERGENRKSDK